MTAQFQNADEIVSFLETTNQHLDMFLDDDLYLICTTLYTIENEIHNDPSLLTNTVLDALHAMAINSPYHDPGFHPHTARQEVCLRSIRVLGILAFLKTEAGQAAINHLDDIITNSNDWILRSEAAGIFCYGRDDASSAALLEKHGQHNSVAGIRQKCRDGLIDIARENPAMVERALIAQIKGINDPDLDARTRSIALLTNRARSTTCDADELLNLRKIFVHAAKNNVAHENVAYWAKKGIHHVDGRTKANGAGEFKFP